MLKDSGEASVRGHVYENKHNSSTPHHGAAHAAGPLHWLFACRKKAANRKQP